MDLQARGHVRSLDKWKLLNLAHYNAYYHKTCWDDDIPLGAPTVESYNPLVRWSCEVTEEIEYISSPFAEELWEQI